MAGMRPFFLTGANAKIRVNGKTLAFATSLSYRIEVKHEDPRVLGMYEGHSLEPVGYRVSGSFSIIRYVADVKDAQTTSGEGQEFFSEPVLDNNGAPVLDQFGQPQKKTRSRPKTVAAKAPYGVKNTGNGIGNVGDNNLAGAISLRPSPREFFNPKLMDRHSAFEIEVFQKVNGEDIPVAKIRGVKLTTADFNVGGKQAAQQNFTFEALYVDEDSFLADFSGRGQQFQ